MSYYRSFSTVKDDWPQGPLTLDIAIDKIWEKSAVLLLYDGPSRTEDSCQGFLEMCTRLSCFGEPHFASLELLEG
jgi:hypothetical protein